MLQFGGYLLRFHLASDWSRNNKHSRNFLWCSRFYGKDCKTITSSEISPLSVTYGVIGDFTTGDGVKRPVCQRVFSRGKNSNLRARRKTFFHQNLISEDMHIPLEGQ